MSRYKQGLAFSYIQGTKYHRDRPMKDGLGSIPSPGPLKSYPGTERIQLPQPNLSQPANLWECLAKRRSERDTIPDPLNLEELARLMWAAQGVTARAGGVFLLRTAPSAGALYPFETYLYIDKVEEVPKGIYHFNVQDFVLERIKDGNYNRDFIDASLGQSAVGRAAVVIIWTAMMLRCMTKYRDRAMRYIPMDLGHVCQNVQLAAVAMGMGSCPIGAFYDDDFNRLLGVDGEEETVIYLITVGKLA